MRTPALRETTHREAVEKESTGVSLESLLTQARDAYAKSDYDLCINLASRSIRVGGLNSASYQLRGDAYSLKKDYANAISDYEACLNLDSDDAHARNALAWLLATCPRSSVRDGERAVKLAQRACVLTEFKDPYYLDTVAAAYAEAGDFSNAVLWQKEAIAIAPSNRQDAFKARLELFMERKPYRGD